VARDPGAGAAGRAAPALVAAVAHEELAAARRVAIRDRGGGEQLDRGHRGAREQLVDGVGIGGCDELDRAVAQLRDERDGGECGVDPLLDADRRRLPAGGGQQQREDRVAQLADLDQPRFGLVLRRVRDAVGLVRGPRAQIGAAGQQVRLVGSAPADGVGEVDRERLAQPGSAFGWHG